MAPQRLEIIHLSDSGEEKRKIICLAGRISVFRSRFEEALELYGKALSGAPISERFSILLDGKSFDPGSHVMLGFSDTPLQAEPRTIGVFLRDHGVREETLENLLLSFGLGGLRQAPCNQLSPEQQRILALLAALNSKEQVLVLRDPFVGLKETWIEKIADFLAEWTWRQKKIVVVSKLSTRPEAWVDNEYISRIPLEKPRQHTIGFGGNDESSMDVIHELREKLRQEVERPKAEAVTFPEAVPSLSQRARTNAGLANSSTRHKQAPANKSIKSKASYAPQLQMALFCALIGLGLSIGFGGEEAKLSKSQQMAAIPEDQQPASQASDSGTQTNQPDAATPPTAAQAPVVPVAAKVIEMYPVEIKDAIVKSFR